MNSRKSAAARIVSAGGPSLAGKLRSALGVFALAAATGVSGQVIQEFPPLPANRGPEGIVTGPDGNLWFCEESGNRIGRMTWPAGVVTEFPIPTSSTDPETIVVGPDGNLWFTMWNGHQIGRITTDGVITEFPLPTANAEPEGIAVGPDGNIWFTEANVSKVGRITTDGVITEFSLPSSLRRPEGITAGPDGNLWLVENQGNRIGRMTTAGVYTGFPIPTPDSRPWNITVGADGNLWFSEGMVGKVGRITTAGVITEFTLPSGTGTPDYLTLGPDGNVWFTIYHGNKIGRVTPSGVITEFPLPSPSSNPYGITVGPDQALWFTEFSGNRIARITTAPAIPTPMEVDVRTVAGSNSNFNGVFESGETVQVDPAWTNTLLAPADLTGTASGFTGPAGPVYTITDSSADYGNVGAETTNDCNDSTGNCYLLSVSGARPIAHWDATFTESISPGGISKAWSVHIGESFPDVTDTHQFYAFIENLFHNGVTGGCGLGNYCPENSVTRGQMAVFLLKGRFGSSFAPPPATGTVFNDVPASHPFAAWIESLAGFKTTGGCGSGNYCPDNPVRRDQMAVFLLKSKYGSAFAPPTCTGVFGDVPCPSQFADWIEQLAAEGITGGCGGNNYCPNNPNTRGQMAVFLTKTFGLNLYGP
jgi:streptogramin lyase